MNKIGKRQGISLIALIITIIVLVILTGAVIINAINVPSNANLTVFKENVGTVQDAATIKMLNNLVDNAQQFNQNAKWIGVADGYTIDDIATPPTFDTQISGINVVALDANLKENLGITDEEFRKYYISENGTVFHEGYLYNGVTYYNATTSEIIKIVNSIAVTGTYNAEYTEGEKFDITGLVVEATYNDGSTENVTSSCTFTPTLDTELATTDTIVTITYSGKTATLNITVKEKTLGYIIKDGSMYGTKVSGYTAGGVSDWSVFYEDVQNKYVYLIASNVLTESQIPTIEGALSATYNGYGVLYWSSAPDLQTMNSNSLFMAKWSNYGEKANGRCASALLNTDNWIRFATPTNETIKDYVKGAIGTPTAEMFAASWSEKNNNLPLSMTNKDINGAESANGYYYNYNGSISAQPSGLPTAGNEVYFPKYDGKTINYWLASPGAASASRLCIIGTGGILMSGGANGDTNRALRPVVCIDSDIPATITDLGINI